MIRQNLIAIFTLFLGFNTPAFAQNWTECPLITEQGIVGDTGLRLVENGRLIRPKSDYRTQYTLKPEARQFWHLFAETLRKRGIEFSFIPIPPRGLRTGFEAFAPSAYQPEAALASWKKLMRIWRLLNVDVINLLPTLRPKGLETAFMRDHHWSTIAAQAAALQIAKQLQDESTLQNLPKENYSLSHEEIPHIGSYAKQFQQKCPQIPPPESLVQWSAEWQSDDLFGDAPEAAITVTGASNLNPEFGFTAHLQHALSLPINNSGVSGGGFHQGILSVLNHADPLPYRLLWLLPGYQGDIFKASAVHREVLAAAQGRCTANNAVSEHIAESENGAFSIFIPRPKDSSGALYLQFAIPRTEDNRLAFRDTQSLKVQITTDKGERWQHKFLRKRQGLDMFSLPLPTKLKWQSLKLEFATKKPSTAKVFLCTSNYLTQWPEGIALEGSA